MLQFVRQRLKPAVIDTRLEGPARLIVRRCRILAVLLLAPVDTAWVWLISPLDSFRMRRSGHRPFVILASPRSGSSLLIWGLNDVFPSVSTFGEAFHLKRRGDKSVSRTLADVYFLSQTEHVGCKIFREQLRRASFRRVTCLPGMRVVILRRRNVVRQFVSLEIARSNQQWALSDPEQRPLVDDRRVFITLEQLIAYEAGLAKSYDFFFQLAAGKETLLMFYEDLEKDRDGQFDRVATFLGIAEERQPVKREFVRQNPEPLSELIMNYDDLRQEMIEAGRSDLLRMLTDS